MPGEPRRQFLLPEEDLTFLERTRMIWEAVIEGGVRRVIIHDYPVPEGYNVARVSLNFRMEAGYPDTPIDMVYVDPHLSRRDGKPIAALAGDQFDGKTWQRWSRHRTPQNPWRP